MLTTNMIVDNRYKILDEIGRGGMSIVYRATVERSGKIWAVKEVRKDGRNDYNVVKQNLIAEIQTLKEVKHPKLPEIADVIDNDDSFIIVMDYIEGVSLDKILSKKGAQPEEKVVNWGKQLCEVLGYLHSRDIIYRDMKPSNVMLKKNGEITIIDFGTAKKYEYDSGETTGLGTAGFAAPEQYGGQGRTDPRTDIFCLGMTMYSLLTARDPQREFIPDTSILKENPALSVGLDYIIRKCTKKNPAERYQSCEELLYDLNRYKEIDKGSRKKKVLKVSAFISCFGFSIISGICGLMFQLQAKGLAYDTYQELTEKAEMITLDNVEDSAGSYSEKIDLYTQAIAVPDKAGESTAYLGLLETYQENDSIFTEEEHAKFSYLFTQNELDLRKNPESYLDVCYEAGESIWYYYDSGSQRTKSETANKWFGRIQDYIKENADNEQVKDYQLAKSEELNSAESYYKIGNFYKTIDDRINKGKDKGMYKELFQNLESLMHTVAEEKNFKVQLDLLELTVQALRQYTAGFYQDGIEKKAIQNMCTEIQDTLNEIKIISSHQLYPRKANIQSKLDEAENVIESIYGKEKTS